MIRASSAPAWGLALLLSLLRGGPAAAGPVNPDYDGKKGFGVTNMQGIVPALSASYFVHAINRERTVAENTSGQRPEFNAFNMDDAFYAAARADPSRSVLALQNGTGPQRPVPIKPLAIDPLPLGVTTRTATAGDVTATTTFNVTTLGAGTAAGTVRVTGTAPADAARKTGYAFSYGEVRGTTVGVGLNGQLMLNPNVILRATRGRQKVFDPLNFTVADTSGALLLDQTLALVRAGSEGGGGLSWQNDLLTFDAGDPGASADFAVTVTPLSGSASSLHLQVENGLVVDASGTGPLFGSLSLPSLRSSGSFSLVLPGLLSFDYDLSRFGDQLLTVTGDWAEAGLTGAAPEPASALLLGMGVAGLAAYGLRRGRHGRAPGGR